MEEVSGFSFVEDNTHNISNMTREELKARLDYLLLDFVLPNDSEKRQKVYQEIVLLLEKHSNLKLNLTMKIA